MLVAYKIAVVVVAYFAVFYLFLIEEYRALLTKLTNKLRNQTAHRINTVMGGIHIALGFYVFGCIVHMVWNL